jgi:hypothetical protein
MGPDAYSALERTWPDSVTREQRLLKAHPEWRIKRLSAKGTVLPTVYEATDGVITLRSEDLGRVLDLIEAALREG